MPGLSSGCQLGLANGRDEMELGEKKRRRILVCVSCAPAQTHSSSGNGYFPSVTTPVRVGIPSSQVLELTGLRKHHSPPLPLFRLGYDGFSLLCLPGISPSLLTPLTFSTTLLIVPFVGTDRYTN